VIIAIVNSAIGIYYYLRMLGTIVSSEGETAEKIRLKPLTTIVLVICLLGMLGLGFLLSCVELSLI
jgi:NADH:ubiquinone oxidoreductase subunit 2 (subunit N)